MIVNVWLALRDDAQALIKTRLTWDEETQGEYTGPITDRQFNVFRLMGDRSVVQSLFRKDGSWTPWTLGFDSDGPDARGEITQLIADFPGAIRIVGGWNFDSGEQVTGFPIHPRILEFLPDIVTFDIDGNETSRTRPTVPSDINLGLGQAPRQF